MDILNKDKDIIFSEIELNHYYQLLDTKIRTKSLYLKPNLCLHDLSIETGVSNKNIKKVLNQRNKQTFFDFILKYKVDKAKKLLIQKINNEFTILEIAKESGFNTEDSFIILFKKITQTSPQNYRLKYYNK